MLFALTLIIFSIRLWTLDCELPASMWEFTDWTGAVVTVLSMSTSINEIKHEFQSIRQADS